MGDAESYLEIIESVKATGKLKKGVNEVTKALERGSAKLVVSANDVSPKEITMHLPMLAKEKNVVYGEVSSKEELGAAAGIQKPTAAVAVVDAGKAKDMIKSITEQASEEKEAKKENPEENKKEQDNKEKISEKQTDKKETKGEAESPSKENSNKESSEKLENEAKEEEKEQKAKQEGSGKQPEEKNAKEGSKE